MLHRSTLVVEQPRAGPCCATRSSASGMGLQVARAGEWAAFQLSLCDAQGRASTSDVALSLSIHAVPDATSAACASPLQPSFEQEVVAAHAGHYDVRYRLTLAGNYTVRICVTEPASASAQEADHTVSQAREGSTSAPHQITLGPWSLTALPAGLCLCSSIRRAVLPSSIELGDPFRGEVPLVDRFGNAVATPSRPPLELSAWLARATPPTSFNSSKALQEDFSRVDKVCTARSPL